MDGFELNNAERASGQATAKEGFVANERLRASHATATRTTRAASGARTTSARGRRSATSTAATEHCWIAAVHTGCIGLPELNKDIREGLACLDVDDANVKGDGNTTASCELVRSWRTA